jgi:hypothetical protein
MDENEIALTARKMIALYGPDAEMVAAGRAETYAEEGKILAVLDWETIAMRICDLQQQSAKQSRSATR